MIAISIHLSRLSQYLSPAFLCTAVPLCIKQKSYYTSAWYNTPDNVYSYVPRKSTQKVVIWEILASAHIMKETALHSTLGIVMSRWPVVCERLAALIDGWTSSVNVSWNTSKSPNVTTTTRTEYFHYYRMAQHIIPQQTICNFSSTTCPILKILEAAYSWYFSESNSVQCTNRTLIMQPHYRWSHQSVVTRQATATRSCDQVLINQASKQS